MNPTTRRAAARPRYILFAVLVLACVLCAPPAASADTVQITPANERRLQELVAERNRLAAQNPAQLSAGISALFLHVPYGANTLVGSASVPEQLVVELTRVDCFTYADYVEALKRSSDRAGFLCSTDSDSLSRRRCQLHAAPPLLYRLGRRCAR